LTDAIYKQVEQLGIKDQFKVPRFFFAGKGCPVCNGTGYKGRIGIFEILNLTEEMRKFIISPNFQLDGLKNLARKEGMVTMFEDGIHKALMGITSIDEIKRVAIE